jgi:hypothetical protein
LRSELSAQKRRTFHLPRLPFGHFVLVTDIPATYQLPSLWAL